MGRAHIALAALAGLVLAAFAGPGAAHPPRGIVVAGDGTVYFSSLESVWKIDPRGRLTRVRPRGARHTHELAIDDRGAVYGEDSYYDPGTQTYRAAIWRITPEGRFGWVLPPTPAPLPLGTSLWRDRAGRAYFVANPQGSSETLLFRRERDGRVTRLLGSREGAAAYRQEIINLHGAGLVGPDGAFYFHHGGVLRKAAPAGDVVTLARGLPDRSFGLAVERGGAVLLADFSGRRILRFAPDGRRTVVAATEAPWAPTGVALRGSDLYLLESEQDSRGAPVAMRVRRIPGRGTPTVLARAPVE